jgi:hypothetical protein
MASLEELKRQRELLAEHLEWLDREIAAAGGAKGSKRANSETSASLRKLAQHEVPPGFLLESAEAQASARKGCLWGFALLILSLTATVGLVYWVFYR